MKLRLGVLFSVLALAATFSHRPLAAQQRPPVEVGTRVRVSTADSVEGGRVRASQWVAGTVRSNERDEMVLSVPGRNGDGAFTVPWDAIQRLDVSRGTISSGKSMQRGLVHYVVPGAVFGAGLGAGFALSANGVSSGSDLSARRYAMFGAGGGALVGLIATGLTAVGGEERWERVSTAATHAGVVVRDGGVGVAMQLRF